jgi:copper homeostasis protein
VRVMLRQNPTMSVASPAELENLLSLAKRLAALPIDGLVLGFLQGEALDFQSLETILSAVPQVRVTFHRAFDDTPDPVATIRQLQQHFPQVDRILTGGGNGDWPERKQRLLEWTGLLHSAPLQLLVGTGTDPEVIFDLARHTEFAEVHVGRAARRVQAVDGQIDKEAVRALKSLFS